MRGYRPVLEIQFDGFVFPAFDQIISQLAKVHRRTNGSVKLPITIRIPYGGGIGAVEHHSESPETFFTHIPGLRVLSPSDPQSAYSCLLSAIRSNDPVIFFEPKRRYWDKGSLIAPNLRQIRGGLALCELVLTSPLSPTDLWLKLRYKQQMQVNTHLR